MTFGRKLSFPGAGVAALAATAAVGAGMSGADFAAQGANPGNIFTAGDWTAPAPAITSPPALTNSRTPQINGTAGTVPGDNATVTVKLYSGAAATGTPVQTFNAVAATGGTWSVTPTTLADGTYTAEVTQSDASGNTGAATRTFTVDGTAPDTQITAGPTGTQASRSASFSFTSADGGTGFECRLDGPGAASGSYSSCTSPKAYTSLGDGAYTFLVRATDAAGNTDATPASRTFTVDGSGPSVTITDPGSPVFGTVALQATATDATGVASVVFQTAPAGGSTWTSACTGTQSGSTWSCSFDTSGRTDGTYDFRALATDTLGNAQTSAVANRVIQNGCSAPGTQTLTSNRDAHVSLGSPTANFGSLTTLDVSAHPLQTRRTLVGFALPSIPARCAVTAATLTLTASAAETGRTLQALQISPAATWTETGATWTNQPATAGTAATAASVVGAVRWNVATIVTAMYGSAAPSNGFLIRDSSETINRTSVFSSREAAANRPQLQITFG